MTETILFFGPYSPPITGQSMAFKSVVDSYEQNAVLIDTTKHRLKVLNSFRSIALLFMHLVFRRKITTVYFTCTRSFFGSIKDLFLLFLCGSKIRVINHLHGADFRTFYDSYPFILRPILKIGYKRIHTSIVLSEGMTQEFSNFPEMSVIPVLNFYPSDFEQEITKQLSEIRIIYFSHLMFSKGILDFLKAIKMLSAKHADIVFTLAGDYHSDEYMSTSRIREATESFIADNPDLNLNFHGPIDPQDRFQLFSESDIFVLPTFYKSEGMPLTIIEAMRSGNAIITTDHNYLSDLVTESNGKLIPVKNPESLMLAIETLISNRDSLKKIQENNVETAKNLFAESLFHREVKKVIHGD